MRIFTVVGARPQFIKAAPLSRALRAQGHTEFLLHTGQHYDDNMSAVFFRQLNIPAPDINLQAGSGTHATRLAHMLPHLEKQLRAFGPNWVLVYGDTDSTLAGALAAASANVRIAHVEAGLRSYNRAMPEERNRVLTDHLAHLLFCPTDQAVTNLAHEGITEGVVRTDDIMADAVYQNIQTARRDSNIHQQLYIDRTAPYAVATIHRPANTNSHPVLAEIIAALGDLSLPVIFPAHPRTRRAIQAAGLGVPGIVQLVSPLGYLDMLSLVDAAAVLVTDSGGLQKEAYLLKTPCVTVRNETEWVETVKSGWNRLTSSRRADIIAAVAQALDSTPAEHPAFYGDGHAAEQIVDVLETQL